MRKSKLGRVTELWKYFNLSNVSSYLYWRIKLWNYWSQTLLSQTWTSRSMLKSWGKYGHQKPLGNLN